MLPPKPKPDPNENRSEEAMTAEKETKSPAREEKAQSSSEKKSGASEETKRGASEETAQSSEKKTPDEGIRWFKIMKTTYSVVREAVFVAFGVVYAYDHGVVQAFKRFKQKAGFDNQEEVDFMEGVTVRMKKMVEKLDRIENSVRGSPPPSPGPPPVYSPPPPPSPPPPSPSQLPNGRSYSFDSEDGPRSGTSSAPPMRIGRFVASEATIKDYLTSHGVEKINSIKFVEPCFPQEEAVKSCDTLLGFFAEYLAENPQKAEYFRKQMIQYCGIDIQ